jgi:hypothetical protein
MEVGFIAIPEGLAVRSNCWGWHWRIAEKFLAFDVGRPLCRNITLRRLISVVETLLTGIAILGRRGWWRRRGRRRLVRTSSQSEQHY